MFTYQVLCTFRTERCRARDSVLLCVGLWLCCRVLRLQPASEWNKQFYMPAMSDTGVVAFRRWYHGLAGEVGYAPGVSPELPPLVTDRRVLNDRWGQHSKHCPSCRGAHRTMGKLQVRTPAMPSATTFLSFHVVSDVLSDRCRGNTRVQMWYNEHCDSDPDLPARGQM